MTCLSSPKLLPLYRHIYTNQNQGWEINADKIQGPEQSVKFFRIVWLSKTKVMLAEVIDKIQALTTPQLVKELQSFGGGLLGYWHLFIPHLALIIQPLYSLVKKGQKWDWDCPH